MTLNEKFTEYELKLIGILKEELLKCFTNSKVGQITDLRTKSNTNKSVTGSNAKVSLDGVDILHDSITCTSFDPVPISSNDINRHIENYKSMNGECQHEFKLYSGFTEEYYYCTKCNNKQGE